MMSSEKIYKAIGNIDDDLIIESVNYIKTKHKYRNKIMIAACFVIILIIPSLNLNIHINNLSNIMASPSYMDTETANKNVVKNLSEEDMKTYFGIENIPQSLSNDLILSKNNTYSIVHDNKGIVVEDTVNIIYTDNNEKYVTITLSKLGSNYGNIFSSVEHPKVSKINNALVTIGKFDETNYCAEFNKDLYYTINAKGLEKKEFIKILKIIIKS